MDLNSWSCQKDMMLIVRLSPQDLETNQLIPRNCANVLHFVAKFEACNLQ